MEEILQQIPVTPQQDSERPNSASFRLLHLTSSSMEFTESDYLPHELNTGGFCICLRGKSRVTLNQHRCYIQKGDLCVIFHIYQHGKPLAMSAQTRQESMFREFLFLVSQHYVREREIGYYADQICVTPKYLSSVVRTVSGNSAAWWINHTVIMHAKNLLKTNHQLTIQQISDKLNFPNPSFFGQYFKRRVGMTPKEFRRKAY